MRIATVLLGAGFLFALSATAVEPVKKNSNAFSNVPFAIEGTNIPKNFRGVDPFALYQALLKSPKPIKMEFETTNEFNDRHTAWLNRKIIGDLTLESTIAFVFSSENLPDRQASYKYDADRLKMMFSLRPYLCGGKEMLNISNVVKDAGSYIGQNAYGARKKIERYAMTNFCIDGIRDINIEFPIDLHKAYLEKSAAKFILIGRLKPPYSELSKNYFAPTFDSPSEGNVTNYIINFEVKEVWIISGLTGDLLYKPVAIAVDIGEDEIVDGSSIDYGYDRNGNNALHLSVWNNRTNKSLFLIDGKNININEANKFGATPLHLAVANKNLKIVLALIAAGADTEIKDKDGATPLMDAKNNGNLKIINALNKVEEK